MEKKKKPIWLRIILFPLMLIVAPFVLLFEFIADAKDDDGGFDPHIGA